MLSAPPKLRRTSKRQRLTGNRSNAAWKKTIKYAIPRNTVKFKNGWPATLSTTLRYTAAQTHSVVGNSSSNFRANDCFDPDATLTGHQPRGFDQYMFLYTKFTVTKSRIKVVFNGPGDTIGTHCFIALDNNGTFVVDNNVPELPGVKYGVMNDQSTPLTISNSFDAYTQFGAGVMSNSVLSGDVAASPTEQMLYVVGIISLAGATVSFGTFIDIEYDVTFSERKDVAAS